MSKPTHILVATDYSDASRPAITRAAEVAAMSGAKVTLVHVYDPAPFVPPIAFPSPARKEEEVAQGLAEAIVKGLEQLGKAEFPGTEVAVRALRHASPSKAVVDLAEEIGADLVVVGSHGRTGIEHMFIGSVAEKIVRHAPCSVLVVRPRD